MRFLLALVAAAVLCPGSASASWLEQYRGTEPSVVEVREVTIPARLAQGDPFFALVENWHGGSIRKRGALVRIPQAAAASGKPVKFERVNARLRFGPQGRVAVESAEVVRATDHALR